MSVSQQLKQQFDFLNNAPTTTLAPADIAAIQKAYGFEQPRQQRLSASEREANLAMFNANLEEQSREMGKAFATNTSNLPAEARYRAWQDAQEAFKSQHTNLSEEQQQTALSAFNEYADVFRQADEEAGFFSRTGDLLSYVPTTFTKLGEQAVGLVAPNSDLRKWFTETTADIEDWRSDESKMRALQASDAMAQAKANGEWGVSQFFENAAENPLETVGQFTESALPTIASAVAGAAAAPLTGGASLALPYLIGGVQGAGATRNDIYDQIMAMPQEKLNQSPEYQALLAQGMTAEQARNELASSLKEHGGEVLATGLSGAALNALGGLGRIGQAGKGVLGSTAGKFASELVTEPTDEVFQQFMGNSAIHDIDSTHSLTDGLGEAAAGGLLFGAAGGAVAAADNAYRTPSTTQAQANNDQVIDDVVNEQSEPKQQTQTEQTAQPKSQVNGNVLESILSAYQNDEARFKELYEGLASDIQDGKLQQRLNEGDREYANLARAYLEQTGQLQPQQAVETPQNVANQPEQETQTSQTETITPESVNHIDETQLQQYEQELNQLISEVQAGQITPNAITARYDDIADRYPNHNELAAELSSRKQRVQEIENDPTLDAETKAEQVLYSRSPMKSVEANIKRGQERMTQAILDKADVKRGMYKQEFGWVDFVWGDDGTTKGVNRFGEPRGRGLAHIYEARMRKDGLTEQQVTQMLTNDIVETIAKGTPKQSNRAGNERLELNYLNPNNGQTHRAILTRNKGSNSWLLTGFEVGGGATRPGSATSSPTHINRTHSRDDVVAPMYQNDGQRVGFDTTKPTHSEPTLTRQGMGAFGTDNVQQSTPQRNRQIAQDQQTLSRILGEETASHIQVVDRNTKVPSGRDVKQLATKGVEGWFEPSTQKLYIISDNITANDVLSRDERLAWVAFHELAHAGVRIKYGHLLTNVLESASQNVVVKVLARKIQAEHGYEREIAIEEAMMEIYAAYETGNWAELESRYKTKIHESYKQGKNSVGDFLTRVANALRRLIGGIIGKDLTQTMTTSQVFETLRGIQQGINDIANNPQNPTDRGDVRYSLNEDANSDFAKAVDAIANGQRAETSEISLGTTPDVLKMLGIEEAKVVIHSSILQKDMLGKHSVSAEAMKQLPKQMNNPVAVMRSQPTSSNPNAYLVLTELVEREKGKDKPIIAALNFKRNANGDLELVDIRSAYGRRPNQLNADLQGVMYWHTKKGEQLIKNFSLLETAETASLRSSLLNTDRLIELNIKTEADLSQYQSENSDSNLSETTYNQAKAEGKTELTFQQWKQVRSPEFKAWFGDWENDPENASKVVNQKTGEPLVVYHGTKAEFNSFTPDLGGGDYGVGSYFAENRDYAQMYGNVKEVYLNIREPSIWKNKYSFDKIIDNAERKGMRLYDYLRSDFDGIMVTNPEQGYEGQQQGKHFVAFKPNQIKSATDNNGEFSAENDDIRFSLREDANSDFAKAVDTVAQGGKPSKQYVPMGTTPDVLKMLGVENTKVLINRDVLNKVMLNKHNVTPETLKQLPKQINDPVAVMKSAPQATQQGYVVLTELVEENALTGENEPVISALHLKSTKDGMEVINIASVYGKNLRGMQNMLNHDLLYWHKEKGSQFIDAFGLQLPAKIASNDVSQSANDIKTNDDLSQYQSENSDNNLSETTYNQAKAEGKTELTFQQWKQVRSPEFKAWFGDWENDPENASKVINPKTGEPLVVYHGSNAEFSVFQNTQETDYGYYGSGYYFTQDADIANSYADVAVLERGGNQTNYGVYLNIRSPNYVNLAEHNSLLTGKNETSATEATNRLKSQGFDGVIVFENVATQRSVRTPYNFVEEAVAFNSNQIKSATDNNGQFSSENDDIRFSLRENPNSEFAKAVDNFIDGNEVKTSISMGTTPDVLKMIGLPDVEVKIKRKTLGKVMRGKHAIEPETLKQLPQQLNDPVGIFQSSPYSSNPDGYVVLTELTEFNEENNRNEPVIVALHLDQSGEVQLIEVASAYGKNHQGLQNILNKDKVYYWNKTKGSQLTNVHWLQLPLKLRSDANLSAQNIKTNDDLSQYQSENSDNIRYSVKQSVDDLAKTGKAKQDASQMSKLRSFDGFKSLVKDVGGWLDERVTDGLRPVNDWIDTFKQSGISDHEAERLKDDMYRAKGVRDALNSELESAYLNPIIKKVAAIAKANKMDELSAKRLAGYWISGRYAIEKNNSLLKQDHQAMLDAEKALNEANANGDEEAITLANREYRKAERQYRYRKHDVELALDSDEEFQVGTAGGWSNAEAANFMQNIEKHIPKKDLETLAELVYDLNQKRLEIDHQVGRYTEEQYNEYKANRHYVPLTGDPNADDDFDGISGAGSNALNVSKDRALKGRKLSEAEDGIDASWRAIGKSTTYAGWADFKNRIDFIYETKVDELVEKGYSTRSAREEVENTLGISKSKMKGLTRSNDDVLIRKVGGEYFEYRLPQKVMQALKNDNVEHANAFLKVLSKPTSWYARGVTQWTITFAPMNMMRDAWEKSEFIRVQKLYDKEGNLLDSKTMDKIGRAVLKNAFLDKSTWAATKRLGFNQTLRDSGSEGLLKQLLKDGGVSTYSTYLAKTETDLIKKLKAENNPLAKKLEQAGALLEGYNKIFDNVSALSAYKALIDHGVDPKQAAAKTLELTNFRKTGSRMRGIKALYMFSQPTAMGARNLIKYLSTPKGQKRFIGYMAVMMPLYAALRALDDDDEGGNKMDQLGDITRYIPLPLGLDKYFKIPVGFGMPQMAWNFSVNMVKAMQSDMPISEAATNMFVHSMKTFAPISPSEISAAKFPLEKLALTATPTILQPLMQNVLNRSAFGSQITTNFVRDDKLKSEQSKSTTAQFWKDVAVELNDVLGIDMHPEQIKNLFDGYGSMLGSLKEVQTIFIENPNREQLGRRTRIPFLNQLIGTTNEFAIQSRYYEASEEAQTLANEYNSRKERGKLEGWLDAEKLKIVKWHERNEKLMANTIKEKSKLTRQLRSGTINANVYEARLKVYNQKMDVVQRTLLNQWREMQGLNTTKSR